MANLGELVAPLSVLAVAVAGYFEIRTRQIKKSVDQINHAVNHVQPGQLPLTQRVDRIDEGLVVVQFDQNAIKTELAGLSSQIQHTNRISEDLLKSHVQTREHLDALINKMPKRKDD